jgi:hypothetical protein
VIRHSESIATLAAALVKAQAELPAVTKDATNPHFRNKYASLDAIVAAVQPVLAKHDLAVVQSATTPSDGGAALTVETLLLHKSGEWMANSVVVPMVKIDPQGAGGALTYGRRYGLSALLSLATEEDDDGNVASRPAAKRAPAKKKPDKIEEPEQGHPATDTEPVAGNGAGSSNTPADEVADLIARCYSQGWLTRKQMDTKLQNTWGVQSVTELSRPQLSDLLAALRQLEAKEMAAAG